MGFYSPASLVQDARRHNVRVLPVCVQVSGEKCLVEADNAVRLGLTSLTKVRKGPIQKLAVARAQRPFLSLTDFLRRTDFNPSERRILSASGALNSLATHRRAALWQVEALQPDDELFNRAAEGEEGHLTPLERMTLLERIQANYATMSLTTGAHPMKLLRASLDGVCPADRLKDLPNGAPVKVAGAVITRQRPGTAKGFCFITLEDETGHANAIVRPTLFEQARLVINLVPALLISGHLQNEQGVIHVMAEKIAAVTSGDLPSGASHDYH
jgi:error-prone DNA polymerase